MFDNFAYGRIGHRAFPIGNAVTVFKMLIIRIEIFIEHKKRFEPINIGYFFYKFIGMGIVAHRQVIADVLCLFGESDKTFDFVGPYNIVEIDALVFQKQN